MTFGNNLDRFHTYISCVVRVPVSPSEVVQISINNCNLTGFVNIK